MGQDAPAQSGDGQVLRYGDHGVRVEALQIALRENGYDPGMIDGKFGGRTESAVKSWQTENGLPATGVVDQDMRVRLGLEMEQGRAAPQTGLHATTEAPVPAPVSAANAAEATVQLATAEKMLLVSQSGHPDHGMYQQALQHADRLPAAMMLDPTRKEDLIANVALEAKMAGLQRIEGLVAHPNGSGVFAVDKSDFSDPSTKRVFVEAGPGMRTAQEATQLLDQMNGARQTIGQASQEPRQEIERRAAPMVA
jgi:peptidoglycan hydrolase-like protein with peptidoglycan-binding domain